MNFSTKMYHKSMTRKEMESALRYKWRRLRRCARIRGALKRMGRSALYGFRR